MNLEAFVKRTKTKLIVMSISMILPILIVVIMAIGRWEIGESKSIFQYAPYLPFILCIVFLGYLVYKNVKYVLILKNNEFAKKEFIKKNDERNKYIRLNANSLTHKIFIYALAVITIFAAFVDYQYFFTCALILIVFVIIKIIVEVYYNKKY